MTTPASAVHPTAAEDEDVEEFWDDLLAHLRGGVLVPVIGPELNTVAVDGTCRTLTEYVASRLVEKYALDVPERMTISDAAAAYIRKRRDRVQTLYRVVGQMIDEVEEPCASLRELAEITDLRLFVSTTPDRLLAEAVNAVRFDGRRGARELTFSLNQSTREQAQKLDDKADSGTTIVRLFGEVASTPQYALHDEDRLEWLRALLGESERLPRWITDAIRGRPLLFLGCDIPDWLGRFLLRASSSKRLSEASRQFFFVGTSAVVEPQLSSFVSTYSPTQGRKLSMDPSTFVGEMHRRWQARRTPDDPRHPIPAPSGTGSIFISYLREDVETARRLHDRIVGLGGDVWFDQRRLWPGDSWEDEILDAIRTGIRLFLPVISANTELAEEGYVFREWWEGAQRSLTIPRRRFVIPVVVDDPPKDPSAYHVPQQFPRLNFAHAPGGEPDEDLRGVLVEEIESMTGGHAA